MALIFAWSSRPVPQRLDVAPDWITHGAAWMALALLVHPAIGNARRSRALWCVALCTAYGVSDEWHQSFVPGRVADPLDVLKDFAGSVVGTVAARALARPTQLPGGRA